MSDLLLGIDVGTASTKGVLLRPDGSFVADARADHAMSVPRPGWADRTPTPSGGPTCAPSRGGWSEAVPAGDRIAGVALSAIGPTLLPLDEAGRPLRTGILYGVDTRATEQIAALEARYGSRGARRPVRARAVQPGRRAEDRVAPRARTGDRGTGPLVRDRRARTSPIRLTGELAIDAHTASHWNPLFDPRAIAWSDRFADGITSLDRLPRIGWPADLVGRGDDGRGRRDRAAGRDPRSRSARSMSRPRR